MGVRCAISALLWSLSLSACDGGVVTGASGSGGQDSPPQLDCSDIEAQGMACSFVTFEELSGDIENPERGLTVVVQPQDTGDLGWALSLGTRLVNVRVILEDFRDRPISEDFLEDLRLGFDNLADAGLKAVVRFQYNEGSGNDALDLDLALGHIEQLHPILHDHAEVISVVQAGFIGAWGEWHGSNTGLDSDEAKQAIVEGLLESLPGERMIQLRAPHYKDAIFPDGPLDEGTAYSAVGRSRVGHHNDCFLASDSDKGTYLEPIEDWKEYVAQDSRFVPVGGEACKVSEFTSCSYAIGEMERMHWTYLNGGYPADVIEDWKDAGCFDEIRERLGYRFVLVAAAWKQEVSAGELVPVQFEVDNRGFAAPYNDRKIYVVLDDGSQRFSYEVEGDCRRWLPGESHMLSATVDLSDVPAGTYTLAVWVPDPSERLADDPSYAIRFANQDTWDGERGYNVLSSSFVVAPAP